MLSDHNRKWCEGMSQLLFMDGGFKPYLDLLLRATKLSLENGRLVRSAAALPVLEHVEVLRLQLSAAGPASRLPTPSKQPPLRLPHPGIPRQCALAGLQEPCVPLR